MPSDRSRQKTLSTITPQKGITRNAAAYNTEKSKKNGARPKSSTQNTLTRGRKRQRGGNEGYDDLSYKDPPAFDDGARGLAFGAPRES